MWWRLEEISNNLLDQAQKLKVAIEEAKMNSLNQRIVLMQKVISHFEREQVGKFLILKIIYAYLCIEVGKLLLTIEAHVLTFRFFDVLLLLQRSTRADQNYFGMAVSESTFFRVFLATK